MERQKILWTASSVSLPTSLVEVLKDKGCDIVVANGHGERPEKQMERIIPKVWVTEVTGNHAGFARLVQDITSRFPDISVLALSSTPTVEEAVNIIKSGASEYMALGADPERMMAAIEKCLQCFRRKRDATAQRTNAYPAPREIVAKDPAMKELLELATKAAAREATVLIEGESGVGKEVLARYIHWSSPRKERPFIAINCAALPENLLESELFGHEKGAFTGAVGRKQGKFELANHGTLLLDEISEMAPSIQAKLLRALQEKQIDRVGGRYPIPVDARVIATTNRELEREVKEGNFRLDLYYRLNVVPLRIPPLRERKADIIALAELFLAREAAEYGTKKKTLDKKAMSILEQYHWPGNVRELQNLMERVCIFVDSEVVRHGDIERLLRMTTVSDGKVLTDANVMTLKEMEKKMIMTALRDNNGNRTHAAKLLGISVRTLRNKLKEYKEEANTQSL